MILIDGKKIAESVKDGIAAEIFELTKTGANRPSLAIILVGERPDSRLYVSLKEREAKLVGIDTYRYEFPESASEEEIIKTVSFLNNDPEIDSVLIQLPLPEHISTDRVMATLNPLKDADGFSLEHPAYVESPVIAAVKAMLNDIKIEPENLYAYALYNSEIFGNALIASLNNYGFKKSVGIPRNKIKDSLAELKNADVVIAAIGLPLFLTGNMVKDEVTIIDIGTNKLDHKVVGDVDLESVKDKAAYLSPVPGGVGPLTIAYLFKNVLEIYKNKNLS
jgi:methylenetetrahydrofolate dehydrogenase (NADP+)/methenyltetrahydrofolate cyclohydrolase